MLRHRCGVCAVLRSGCRGQCFAHAAGCPLPPARRTRNAAVPCVSLLHLACARGLLHVVCCPMHVVCCMRCLFSPSFARCLLHAGCCLGLCCLVVRGPLHAVCGLFHVVCCPLPVTWCLLRCMSFVVRCMLLEVWRMLPVARCMSFVVRCISLLHGACCLDGFCCTLRVVCCISSGAYLCRRLHFSRCMSSIVCCTLSSGRLRHAVRGIVSACTFSVACGLLPAARPECPLSHGVRCLSPGPASRLVTLDVLRCASSVACCRPHVPCCFLSLGRRPSHSCMPHVASCRVAQRRHTRSASRRRSPLSAAVAGEARCSADRGGRAPV